MSSNLTDVGSIPTACAKFQNQQRELINMTTINHEVNEMIQMEEDIYNVIVDLKAMLEVYVSGSTNNSTQTQALATIKEANQLLKKLKEA